ncbi:hypothetical protein COU48_00300, partial [Candidatus Nomurabacteria bacterium CG10_big_fil_rev_8_21_14_0_10_03_31_7]
MNSETRNCQNCKQDFTIDSEDFNFYEKIKVPPPTFCSLCRLERRAVYRNERKLFKVKDFLTGKDIFSLYPAEGGKKSVTQEEWFSDALDNIEYGRNYDFSKSFSEQLFELDKEVPIFPLRVEFMVNSPYCANATALKNCYLCFNGSFSENCAYSNGLGYSRDCFDCSHINHSELCYESFWLSRCQKIFFSSRCKDSYDIYFSKDIRNCNNCFGCANLQNKSYCIFNQPYSKEGYFKKMISFNIGSFSSLKELIEQINKTWLKFPNRFMEGTKNIDVTGEYIFQSKHVHNSFLIREAEDIRFCQYLQEPANKDCYDQTLFRGNELTYENAITGDGTYNTKFSVLCWTNINNLEYCINCVSCGDCFGCVGLRNKEYCILNKQYTKEEYEALVPKIIDHMNAMPYVDKKGRVYKYGEFFPPELSPFSYNETIAQEYFPLTKEQALSQGYSWKDPEERNLKIDIKTEELPDLIKDVKDDIVGKVIECATARNWRRSDL